MDHDNPNGYSFDPLDVCDIRVGDYVAISHFWGDIPDQESPFGTIKHHFRPDGRPMKVLAVSPPFLGVEDRDGDRAGLDLRQFGVMRLSDEYVQNMVKSDASADVKVKSVKNLRDLMNVITKNDSESSDG